MANHSKTHRRCILCKNTYRLECFRSHKNGAKRNLGYRYVCQWCTETSYKKMKNNAEHRGYSFELTEHEFEKLRRNPCYYCGFGNVSGLDRVDNQIGYNVDNCVPCCKLCNELKRKHSQDLFIEKCKQIARLHSA